MSGRGSAGTLYTKNKQVKTFGCVEYVVYSNKVL